MLKTVPFLTTAPATTHPAGHGLDKVFVSKYALYISHNTSPIGELLSIEEYEERGGLIQILPKCDGINLLVTVTLNAGAPRDNVRARELGSPPERVQSLGFHHRQSANKNRVVS